MATSHKFENTETRRWTFGAELELVDWPNREPLAPGMAIDENERANVNSDGVAVDGRGHFYHLGGEILTAPSTDVSGPADQLAWVLNKWPQATHNFRTGLNIHVRVPGLRDDLARLKRLQRFIHREMPDLLPIIDPIPVPTAEQFPDPAVLKAAKKDRQRCVRNHHALLPAWRVERQMAARTPQEFFEAEALHPATGKVHWAIVLRACVNLRQLMQTDTVEFRHFPGTSSPAEVLAATVWCRGFLEAALEGGVLMPPVRGEPWPDITNQPYDPWLDAGYYYTSRHYNDPGTVAARIEDWLCRKR